MINSKDKRISNYSNKKWFHIKKYIYTKKKRDIKSKQSSLYFIYFKGILILF